MGVYDLFRTIAQSSLSTKDRTINQIKYDIALDFEDSPSYETILINNVSKGVHIVTDKKDNKVMLSKPDESFVVGDIVTWNSNKFLVTDIDENQNIQTKGTIQLCNNTISFYNKSGISWVLNEIPCIIDSNVRLYSMGTDENKYLSIPSTDIVVRVSNTTISSQIKRDDIFKIGMQNYEVVDLNDVIENGLIILKMKWCDEEQVIPVIDDIPVTGITYILTGSDEIIKGYSENYTVTKYNNGVIVPTAEFTFSIIAGSTPVGAYTLNIVDANECSLTAIQSIYTITLRATDNSNAQVVEKTIKLLNLF